MGGNFCDRDGDGWIKDHKRCADCLEEAELAGRGIDCDDSFSEELTGGHPCDGGDDGDTKTSKKNIALIMAFNDMGGDNVQSDSMKTGVSPSPFGDNEDRVGVDAGGRSAPNPAAGIHLGMSRKNGRGRQVFLDISCEAILSFPATDGPDHDTINQCGLLSALKFDFGSVGEGILGHLPDCEVGNMFCDLNAMVRPYKEACPETLLNGECPDVFTMAPTSTELMSFKLGSPGLTVEVASAIGGDGVFDPGNCLSLHPDPEALAEALCAADGDCNVSVTAYNDSVVGGENDEWHVVADGVTALMCNRQTGTLLGKAILTFGFDAIKK